MPESLPNHAQIMPKSLPNHCQIMPKSYPNHARIMPNKFHRRRTSCFFMNRSPSRIGAAAFGRRTYKGGRRPSAAAPLCRFLFCWGCCWGWCFIRWYIHWRIHCYVFTDVFTGAFAGAFTDVFTDIWRRAISPYTKIWSYLWPCRLLRSADMRRQEKDKMGKVKNDIE